MGNISLSLLRELICQNRTVKFILSSENQPSTLAHINYKLEFDKAEVFPERNEIKLVNGDSYFKLRCIRKVVRHSIDKDFGLVIDVFSQNYGDETAPYKYSILVQ